MFYLNIKRTKDYLQLHPQALNFQPLFYSFADDSQPVPPLLHFLFDELSALSALKTNYQVQMIVDCLQDFVDFRQFVTVVERTQREQLKRQLRPFLYYCLHLQLYKSFRGGLVRHFLQFLNELQCICIENIFKRFESVIIKAQNSLYLNPVSMFQVLVAENEKEFRIVGEAVNFLFENIQDHFLSVLLVLSLILPCLMQIQFVLLEFLFDVLIVHFVNRRAKVLFFIRCETG
jgi:hypothetical protein